MNIINDTHRVPSCWEEISAKDKLYIFRQWHLCSTERISLSEFKLRIFIRLARVRISRRTLMGIKMARRYPNHAIVRRAREISFNIQILYEGLFGFILDNENMLTLQMVAERMPDFRISFYRCTPPDILFRNMSFGQFRKSYDLMLKYVATADRETLFYALSVMCCKGEYNESKALEQQRRYRSIAGWRGDYLLKWFFDTVKYIQSEDIMIDSQKINFSCLFPQSQNSSEDKVASLGWTSVLYDVASLGVLGDTKKVDSAPLFDVLQLLLNEYNKNSRTKC